MAEGTHQKIKLIRCKLGELIRIKSNFGRLEKHLKDSEVYLNLQIQEWSDEFKVIKELHSEISQVADEGDEVYFKYIDDHVFQTIQDIYFKHTTNLHELLKIITASEKFDATFSEYSHAAFRRSTSSGLNPDVNLSLFNVNIDPFDGTYDKWAEFKDSFTNNVHENQYLNDAAKIKILQSLLKGDAQKLVKREFGSVKASDYEEVWKKLHKRYNHKRSLINSYFSVLFYQPTIEKETADALKRLYDTTFDTLVDLKNLDLKVDDWGDILLFLVHSKLPLKTKESWEERNGRSDNYPKFSKFMEFLETRFRTLESLEATRKAENSLQVMNKKGFKKVSTFQSVNHQTSKVHQKSTNVSRSHKSDSKTHKYNSRCRVCKEGTHSLRNCQKFIKLSIPEREEMVKSLGFCLNCFGYSHNITDCVSEGRCSHCGQKHHSLLHASTSHEENISHNVQDIQSTSDGRFSNDPRNISTYLCESDTSVIFPTALVKVSDSHGKFVVLRALIDTCSDVSYITKEAANKLHLTMTSSLIQAKGVGDVLTTKSSNVVSFQLQSLISEDFTVKVRAYVLPKISSHRPVNDFKVLCPIDSSIRLADPTFNAKSKIDLLLGGNVDAMIRRSGFKRSEYENLNFQETALGWIVSGSIQSASCFMSNRETNISLRSLDISIRKFWELEDMPNVRSLTKEEDLCEKIFDATTRRLNDGRFSVSLPFKFEIGGFEGMRKTALHRFAALERKLGKNDSLRLEYTKCMNEYSELNHMYEVDPQLFSNPYYIPHHCVIKESSTTTKLRVVFDASAKDSNLVSLNDCLLNGPRLQSDLLDLLIRFRFHKIAFTADIEKMYRQILINPNDHRYHLIVWRENQLGPIRTYAMKTVTFGTSSAPYLAVKTLCHLADVEQNRFPFGAQCLRSGFYVDDCIYGADTLEEAMVIQQQLLCILNSAGFHLRKWSSNCPNLLARIPETDRETSNLLEFDSKQSVKTLGIQWSPISDQFFFQISVENHEKNTKRTVLSDIAKIFDPMGFLSPVIISAKLLIQKLWSENRSWDEELSPDSLEMWKTLKSGLFELNSIAIPRWFQTKKLDKLEIHGFSDASQRAYAAAIYIKTISQENEINVNIVFSKTKVAPLKNISLPRLELMGALLLAKMMDHLKANCWFTNSPKYFYWSDSEITLAWIHDDPHKRAVFVANRITEIQAVSNPSDWRYVNTLENPADLGTRGVSPSLLHESNLWWFGPDFLREHKDFNYQPDRNIELPEEDNVKGSRAKTNTVIQSLLTERRVSVAEVSSNMMRFSVELLNRYSTLPKLVRVVSYCLRFLKKNRKEHTHVSSEEYECALLTIIRMVQLEVYSEELEHLSNGRNIDKQSPLYSLHPIVSAEDKVLRVSSRLSNADHLNFDQKFPIILPATHVVSKLIVRHAHLLTFHGTHQETIMLVLQRYHIIKCKNIVRYVINRCVRCFRIRCKSQEQQMGLLPQYRITPNRPFLNCGLDFAGPFELKKYRGRCNQFYKSYFCIFICFATKAIHLEVVIDLSSQAFIAAYRRFIGRRGLVRNIYSDCGTNFVGAQKTLTKSNSDIRNQWNEEMANELAEFKTNWHFNPPGSPHFGGLWEAGVKCVKHHLKRVIGETHLTYDEFETILIQIEAILNSRPLCPAPANSNDLVLTPAHFLVQDSLLSIPDDNLDLRKLSHADRWIMIQKLLQRFWKLWSDDYLNTLRQRKKWRHCKSNVQINDVVIVKENNLPPNKWVLGIITQLHPGTDGLTRVVTVKTRNNVFQRPVVKIAPLPIHDSNIL